MSACKQQQGALTAIQIFFAESAWKCAHARTRARHVTHLSVMQLPAFWLEPEAKEFAEVDFLAPAAAAIWLFGFTISKRRMRANGTEHPVSADGH